MSRRALRTGFMVFAIATIAGGWVVRAQEKPKTTLKDLAWMVGDWRASVDGDQLQEIWTAPLADSMIGMFRWVKKDGKVSLFEFLTMTDDDGKIAFRFRHFGRVLTAWEEKDAPLTFKLTRATDREVVFENPDQKQLLRLTYQRDGSDKYSVLIDGMDQDGKPTRREFQFARSSKAEP